MASSLSNWIKRNIVSRYMMNSCPEEQECLQVLEVILDQESSPEEEKIYFEHIQKCWHCFQNYNLEKSIRQLIRSKIEHRKVPEDLIKKIKSEIKNSSIE